MILQLEGEQKITITPTELNTLIEEVESEIIEAIKHSEEFSGPIPNPSHMKQYQEIDPSFPNRLLTMAESNLQHQQSIEKNIFFGNIFMGFLGWLTPSGIASYIVYHAIIFTKDGKSIEALIALVGALATLGGEFYMKRRTEKNDNAKAIEENKH